MDLAWDSPPAAAPIHIDANQPETAPTEADSESPIDDSQPITPGRNIHGHVIELPPMSLDDSLPTSIDRMSIETMCGSSSSLRTSMESINTAESLSSFGQEHSSSGSEQTNAIDGSLDDTIAYEPQPGNRISSETVDYAQTIAYEPIRRPRCRSRRSPRRTKEPREGAESKVHTEGLPSGAGKGGLPSGAGKARGGRTLTGPVNL